MAVGNIDLNQEIESWKSAVYGKDVRAANVAAFEKIQGTVNDTVQNVNQAAEDSASAAHNAQAAVDNIQAAVTTVTGKAAEAATSASQAADFQAAADSSKTAAAQSETNAAASAAEARQIAEGFGGFDGTAASVKATDTYGLVVDALGESTTQALIDAVANKVINELIAKSNIVNNLLATEVGTVLSGALGPIIDQRLTDLMNKYTQLNGERKVILYGTIRVNDYSNGTPVGMIVPNGTYLAVTNQFGGASMYGIVLCSITDHTGGSGCIKLGGGKQFMESISFSVDVADKKIFASSTVDQGYSSYIYKLI